LLALCAVAKVGRVEGQRSHRGGGFGGGGLGDGGGGGDFIGK